MLRKQRIHYLNEGFCDKTFKNLLRGDKENIFSPHKEYLLTQIKEDKVSPRTERNHAKFFNKEHLPNQKESNLRQKKYISNYVKGELRSSIDFNTPGKDFDDRKYKIRTKSIIEKQNPTCFKETKDDIYVQKRNSVAKLKMIDHMYKKNPICSNLDEIKANVIEKGPTRNYLDSSNMKNFLQHPQKTNLITFKNENSDLHNKCILEQSKAINTGNRKYLKNGTHAFGGKTGYYM